MNIYKTRPDTRLPKSRAGGQGPYLRSPYLGRSRSRRSRRGNRRRRRSNMRRWGSNRRRRSRSRRRSSNSRRKSNFEPRRKGRSRRRSMAGDGYLFENPILMQHQQLPVVGMKSFETESCRFAQYQKTVQPWSSQR